MLRRIKHIKGAHSGENMAASIIYLIEDYGVTDKIGYFILNNTSSNDTCVKAFLKKLHSDLNPNHC